MGMLVNRMFEFMPVFFKHIKSNNMESDGKGNKKSPYQQNYSFIRKFAAPLNGLKMPACKGTHAHCAKEKSQMLLHCDFQYGLYKRGVYSNDPTVFSTSCKISHDFTTAFIVV
jgi:hypothetical protein